MANKKKQDTLKILFVATEVAPYAKSGGLGDVAGSLPEALRTRGADVRVVMPKYGSIPKDTLTGAHFVCSFMVHLSWRSQSASVHAVSENESGADTLYLIENDYYFGRDGYYGFMDDHERFAFFSKASVELLNHISFQADIIHFNDWQTGLGCTYLRDVYRGFTFYENTKSLFTIHNLHYQGVFGREVLWAAGLNDGYFTNGDLEFYNNISYLKAGLNHSDAVSTVSETYAEEIQTPAYGYGMDGLLRKRGIENNLYGIVNGIDTAANDPRTDKRIFFNYSADNFTAKRENKQKLQETLNLPVSDAPMLSVVSRLVDQKGFDIIAVVMDELMSKDLQLVILGTGDGRYENLFGQYAWRYPHKVSANITFNDSLAQRIYAGSDIFLMPSVYEPCGLGQLFAMRYGTIPVVRKTGGLADTVRHFNPEAKTGNGFVFEDYVASGLMWALNQALETYGSDNWNTVIRNAMSGDFSWEHSADRYIEMYNKIKG